MLTRIKLCRLQIGARQLELSQRAGITRQRLSELECGYVEPRADELERLADALGLPVGELTVPVPGVGA